jgi:uncharacterized protein
VWHAPETAFEKVLRKEKLTIEEHLEIDDSDVLFHIKQWQRSKDPILKDLSERFTGRRLFKAVDLDMNPAEQVKFLAAARACVSQAGFDSEYYFIEDRASDVPYNYYTVAGAEPKSRIYVEDGYARPVIKEISEVSDVVRGLQRGYELHRVCFPAEVKQDVYALYHRSSSGADRTNQVHAVGD